MFSNKQQNNLSGQKQEVDVFEMILQSMNDGASIAKAKAARKQSQGEEWESQEDEGQLGVDVAHTAEEVVAVSTMAGALADKIEVLVHNDLLTIRGVRRSPLEHSHLAEYVHSECFWGKFSRTIVLPFEVRGEEALAEYKNGVLTVRIPKRKNDNRIPVLVVED